MSTPEPFEDNELDQESQFSSASQPGLAVIELTMEQELEYHRAQDGLLEQAQKRVKALEDELAEIKRPLDAQMARLNDNLTAANERAGALESAITTALPIVELLLELTYAAWNAADNSEQRMDTPEHAQEIVIHLDYATPLNDALEAVDALPDDQPGYTMGPAAKARWALRRLMGAKV